MNIFSAGYLVGRPAVTSALTSPTTPRQFGQLQEVSFDVSYTTKKLMGPGSFPLREFRGEAKVDLKAKFAQIDGKLFAELFFGVSETTGATIPVFGEAQNIPSSVSYVVTATNAGALGVNFVEDYGPVYASNGAKFKLVSSAPTQGQYMLGSGTTAGQYTFSAADAGVAILLNYQYSNATAGFTHNAPNAIQSESPYFEIVLSNPSDGGFTRRIFKASASKITQNFKMGDIVIPEMDISVYDPGTGVMWTDSYAAA
jgi:hypothetical protein